jgi:hypothetical protein
LKNILNQLVYYGNPPKLKGLSSKPSHETHKPLRPHPPPYTPPPIPLFPSSHQTPFPEKGKKRNEIYNIYLKFQLLLATLGSSVLFPRFFTLETFADFFAIFL